MTVEHDIELAKKICEELCNNNNSAIKELITKYHKNFIGFTRKKLYNLNEYEDVVNAFWTEAIDKKLLCNYKGKSSLKTYLQNALYNRIKDANRVSKRVQTDPLPENTIESNAVIKKIVRKAIFLLSKDNPIDAEYIWMHYFHGLSYEEMAERLLKAEGLTPENVRIKAASLSKQMTRKEKTGSQEKFKTIFLKCMQEEGISLEDILS